MFAYYHNIIASPCFSVNFERGGSYMKISTQCQQQSLILGLFLPTILISKFGATKAMLATLETITALNAGF
jgi:hypothetical protein